MKSDQWDVSNDSLNIFTYFACCLSQLDWWSCVILQVCHIQIGDDSALFDDE